MKLNLQRALLTIKGDLVRSPSGEAVSLRDVLVDVLLIDEQNMAGEVKLRQYHLARALTVANDTIEVTVEDLAKMKELVGRFCTVLVAGQVMPMLDNPEASAPALGSAAEI